MANGVWFLQLFLQPGVVQGFEGAIYMFINESPMQVGIDPETETPTLLQLTTIPNCPTIEQIIVEILV